ncbi:hyaluronidase PH-20-like [Peromyscus leucopus]|uniref:hyaluronidase PH-20-like n=1 Tax=Peromyscus leucopus TaxID=10041 RepID=UPI0010A16DE4|nr:hyaluronidase PH-20-like [Peromyscus leucopus]
MGGLRFKHLYLGSFVESGGTFQSVLIIFLLIPCSLTMVDYRAVPVLPNETFLWIWNVPTEACIGAFNHSIDLSLFPLIGSPRKTATGQAVTIFYANRLGKYPYIDKKQAEVFGGIPQAGNLQEHLDKVKTDIEHYIPVDQLGLAIIDWEEWRPTWARNWTPKDIYRNKSIQLVQTQDPGMNTAQATKKAKEEFEKAARKFMEETLKLGKRLKPRYLWGFYLFPDCYNNNYLEPGYDGKCPSIEIDRNNDLGWIWKESTALYPSTYLRSELKLSPNAKLYSRYRILEGIRTSKVRGENNPLPVFLYTRVVFTNQVWEFLSINDLVNTIGEAVALGTSGIVIWDSIYIAQCAQTGCPTLHKYMRTTLNPYIINATLAAKMCSQTLCSHRGICTRKDVNSDHYIQLNPKNLEIKLSKNGSFEVVGNPTVGDLKYFSEHFKCNCFTNMDCKERSDIENVGNVKVCTANGICIDTRVEPDQAFCLLPGKSFLFFIAINHILYHLL